MKDSKFSARKLREALVHDGQRLSPTTFKREDAGCPHPALHEALRETMLDCGINAVLGLMADILREEAEGADDAGDGNKAKLLDYFSAAVAEVGAAADECNF
jgi:hypothetical protein